MLPWASAAAPKAFNRQVRREDVALDQGALAEEQRPSDEEPDRQQTGERPGAARQASALTAGGSMLRLGRA